MPNISTVPRLGFAEHFGTEHTSSIVANIIFVEHNLVEHNLSAEHASSLHIATTS